MIVDLFAGAGGWDVAAEAIGLDPVFGIENDKWACATRVAAGLRTVQQDLSTLDPTYFEHGLTGIIASPPCQSWSVAGKRKGFDDPRGLLVRVPMQWVRVHRPQWAAFEQVPPVLPIWEENAAEMRTMGYSAWTGFLQAEQYGVPQTRKRAILIASRAFDVSTPPPTHSRYYPREPQRFDSGVLPWVAMAEALGWGYDVRRSHVVTGGGTDTGGPEPFGHAARKALEAWVVRTRGYRKTSGGNLFPTSTPARALTEKVRSWVRERPAPTIVGTRRTDDGIVVGRQLPEGEEKNPAHGGWTLRRPATTVVGRFASDVISAPTYRHAGDGPRQKDGIRITVAEASILQSFPPDYPWQGPKSRQFQQIGNAIPPLLALHILAMAAGVELRAAA